MVLLSVEQPLIALNQIDLSLLLCLHLDISSPRDLNSRLVLFIGFYSISTLVGYLTPNPFLCK